MALVAYDYSDSSDIEDEENGAVATLITKPVNKTDFPDKPESHTIQNEAEESAFSIFKQLPKPTNKKPTVIEEDDEFLHKKETTLEVVKPKTKILVPSLNDFKDVEGSILSAKPKTSNGKTSSLLSMLPQPKCAVIETKKSFIPNVLKQKSVNDNVKKKASQPPPSKKTKLDTKALPTDYSDDSDDDVQTDFFSINKPVEVLAEPTLEIDEKVQENIEQPVTPREPRSIESYFKPDTADGQEPNPNYSEYDGSMENQAYNSNDVIESNCQNTLDEEAILKLCGARGKQRREEIQIVDINQQDVLADAREWLAKGLMDDTTKRVSASKKKGNEPTNQQKRKHQITYLAHQAKANEAELQNQWANNRMSRRQTQSKYGF